MLSLTKGKETAMSAKKTSMFHEGHRALQDKFDGRRLADALEKHRKLDAFREEEVSFIQSAEFFFIATAHDQSVDCSFRGGVRGFVRVTGPTRLEWTDLDGNSMYRTMGNILKSPRVGLLFIEFGPQPRRLRVNGQATLIEGSADRGHKLTVQVDADEIFPNCPRYIPNLAKIADSEFLPDAEGVGAKPGWKDMEGLRDALPEHDPHRD